MPQMSNDTHCVGMGDGVGGLVVVSWWGVGGGGTGDAQKLLTAYKVLGKSLFLTIFKTI